MHRGRKRISFSGNVFRNKFGGYVALNLPRAERCGRAIEALGLRPLLCWNCGFESRWRRECWQLEACATSWQLVQVSPTGCVCLIVRYLEFLTMRRPKPDLGRFATKRKVFHELTLIIRVHLGVSRHVWNGWHGGRSTFLRHEFKYLSLDRLRWLQVCRFRPHFFYTNKNVVPQITPRPLSSLSCDNRYWLVIRPFDTKYFEILRVSLNNP